MSLFLHSLKMVRKNFKSYLLLSITILISFSLLLAYLIYQDSTIYNSYKWVARLPQEVLRITPKGGSIDMAERAECFERIMARLNACDADYYLFATESAKIEGYDGTVRILYLPEAPFAYYQIMSGGEFSGNLLPEGKTLGSEEVWVSEGLYHTLQAYGETTIKISSISDQWANYAPKEYTITEMMLDSDGKPTVAIRYDPQRNPEGFKSFMMFAYAPIEYHEEIVSFVSQNGYLSTSSYLLQRDQAVEKAKAAQDKALLVVFLYLILAVNLYGSFQNALNDRKFEIGVKRAVGAGKASIVGQFLSEGMVVMLGNMLLSAILVIDGFLLYKLLLYFQQYYQWIIVLTPYSLLTYLICCLGLSVSFSLMFAYRTTQVNVIENLRAE
ncbi:MAG: ABC transporter permease [Christensenellaceae bacterium]